MASGRTVRQPYLSYMYETTHRYGTAITTAGIRVTLETVQATSSTTFARDSSQQCQRCSTHPPCPHLALCCNAVALSRAPRTCLHPTHPSSAKTARLILLTLARPSPGSPPRSPNCLHATRPSSANSSTHQPHLQLCRWLPSGNPPPLQLPHLAQHSTTKDKTKMPIHAAMSADGTSMFCVRVRVRLR
jgi:hypothetical protein